MSLAFFRYPAHAGFGGSLPSKYILLGGGPGMCVSYAAKVFRGMNMVTEIVPYQHFGASGPSGDRGLPADFNMESMVDDLNKFVKIHQSSDAKNRLGFIAHSCGAYFAMEYIKKYGDDVKSLIFISPLPFSKAEYDKGIGRLLARIPQADMDILGELTSDKDPNGFKMMRAIMPYYVERDFNYDDEIFFYSDTNNNFIIERMGDYDHVGLAKEWGAKTLYILGSQDFLWNEGNERADVVRGKLQVCSSKENIEILKGVGHYPFLEDRDGFETIFRKHGLVR